MRTVRIERHLARVGLDRGEQGDRVGICTARLDVEEREREWCEQEGIEVQRVRRANRAFENEAWIRAQRVEEQLAAVRRKHPSALESLANVAGEPQGV